jgi:DNA helicase-2/ATP-dependent DNA helicase PcrA
MASTAAPESDAYPGDVLRVWGPPGTGKTTYLAKRVRSTVAQHGPDSLLLASFSTTAANEIGSRFAADGAGARPAASMIGTLHSHAYRALGQPPVALDPRVLADWNSTVAPELRITPDNRRTGGGSGDSGSLGVAPELARTGDELIGALDRLRAGRLDPQDWPVNVREFAQRWEDWKREVGGAVDYTDMITNALEMAHEGVPAPGRPSYLIVDEAQDMTPLEVGLALAWGRLASRLVLGMDDDQAINRWRGGDPEPLLTLHGDGVSDEVLDRSYRVPEAVRAVAETWVRRLSHRREKLYYSRLDDAGRVVPGVAHHVPESLHSTKLIDKVLTETDAGRTVMIIASCNYMLERLIENLRERGVPFHNPYRPGEQRWNPLGAPTREGAMSTSERIRRFLALTERDWTGADMQAWIELVKLTDAGMVRGAKTAIAHFPPNDPVPYEQVAALFADSDSLALATEPDPAFLERALLKAKIDVARYPLQLARNHGAAALDQKPQVVIGTIHSVKGAAADVVYVSPDISAAAAKNMSTRAGADEAIRLFYVAMTRAYEELRLLTPVTGRHMVTTELIPPHLEVTT